MRRKISGKILRTAIDLDPFPEEGMNLTIEAKDFVTRFLRIHSQLYILHWQTKSYARHKAYDETLDSIVGLVDGFMESYQGKYGRISIGGETNLHVADIGSTNEIDLIQSYRDFLMTDALLLIEEDDDDLKNILDEMVASLNKLLYLLTLE